MFLWKPHTDQQNKEPISDNDCHGIGYDNEEDTKNRNQSALSNINSPFRFSYLLSSKRIGYWKISKSHLKLHHSILPKIMHWTSMCWSKPQWQQKYLIPHESCHTMLKLIKDGPIHPLHLKNFFKCFLHQQLGHYSSNDVQFPYKYKCLEKDLAHWGMFQQTRPMLYLILLVWIMLLNIGTQILCTPKCSKKQCQKYYMCLFRILMVRLL